MSINLAEARRDLAAILRWSSRLGLSEGISASAHLNELWKKR